MIDLTFIPHHHTSHDTNVHKAKSEIETKEDLVHYVGKRLLCLLFQFLALGYFQDADHLFEQLLDLLWTIQLDNTDVSFDFFILFLFLVSCDMGHRPGEKSSAAFFGHPC